MEKAVLTVGEAAAILRVSKSKFYQLARENKVPHIEIGKRQVIPAEPFYAWINHSVVGG